MKTFAIVAALFAVSLIFVAESQAGGFGFGSQRVFVQAGGGCGFSQQAFVQQRFIQQRQVFVPSFRQQRVFVQQAVPVFQQRVVRQQVFVPQNQNFIFNFDD